MPIELTISNLAALAVAFVGALWALVKIIAMQQEKSLEARFKTLAESLKDMRDSIAREQETTQRLERELLQFKAELPREYVRREDFIRAVGTIETKIDNMALRMERAVLNANNNRSDA
jgi:chromosome segregation ATPase